ncbi:YnbE family lipoprotein [Desulfogranum marinum]|uniref:YnbE family lipoprotein n=1 Tax=Desulfogranum marinum TaxID=453220 RepID=UPI001964C068|nr:YnbE family lipoprotein [Desulfogranum marinum]MBM9510893.1 YnbE family lipoprotein [Desulfogranum marinum]
MLKLLISTMTLTAFLIGCTPTVQVAPPEKPITINLNVKIEHAIQVKVEKALDDVISKDSGLF